MDACGLRKNLYSGIEDENVEHSASEMQLSLHLFLHS
jgi:hypothetical protein